MENKHLFAVAVDEALPAQHGESVRLLNEQLWTRVVKILRLRAGERVILFNKEYQIELELLESTFSTKNAVCGVVRAESVIVPWQPAITLLQGVTKKSAFEEILYNAAQLAVGTIVPIKTTKSVTGDFSPKEMSRFSNIMIAACEQAKQFVIPQLVAPVSLQDALILIKPAATKIVFDSSGNSCMDVVTACMKNADIVTLFGSEGGLTDQELSQVVASGFAKVRLTPTILRSEDAPLLGIGMVRSFIA